jgi:hypothetical protein
MSPLHRRQLIELSCAESGMKDCGTDCIPITYTCCPSGAGGCPTATTECQLMDNGEYGCCPIGETCVGDGGVNTIPGGTETIIETIDVPGETSTIEVPEYTTTETPDVTVTETETVPEETYTTTETPDVTVSMPSVTPTAPTNGTGPIPSASPSVPLFPGAADKTAFSPFGLLAVVVPFLFA